MYVFYDKMYYNYKIALHIILNKTTQSARVIMVL